MSDYPEFYCVPNDSRTIWDVRRRTEEGPEFLATFKGPHAEADAHDHIGRCNARAKEEREAKKAQWPWFSAFRIGPDGSGGETWRIVMESRPLAVPCWVADFYGDGAETGALAFVGRLNAAVADPEPPSEDADTGTEGHAVCSGCGYMGRVVRSAGGYPPRKEKGVIGCKCNRLLPPAAEQPAPPKGPRYVAIPVWHNVWRVLESGQDLEVATFYRENAKRLAGHIADMLNREAKS